MIREPLSWRFLLAKYVTGFFAERFVITVIDATLIDAAFVSTGRRELSIFEGIGARVYHMPNPVVPAAENLNNAARTNLSINPLFCSKSTDFTKRLEQGKFLKDFLGEELNFKTYGSFDESPLWG